MDNMDELGLCYQAEPKTSFNLKKENCVGEKHSKLHLKEWAAANEIGKRLAMFVIGKTKSHRCLKSEKCLFCQHRCQKNSWMDCILSQEWFRETD